MVFRDCILIDLKNFFKVGDKCWILMLCFVFVVIKDCDIVVCVEDCCDGCEEQEIMIIFIKLVKQCEDSVDIYEKVGCFDLVEVECEEVDIVCEFLFKLMDEGEIVDVVVVVVIEFDVIGLKDMGCVMGELKFCYVGCMDFGKVGGCVKDLLIGVVQVMVW